jgi:hypothetical protein
MTEWYTHFDPLEFGKVSQIQAELLRPKQAVQREESADFRRPHLTLVKVPQEPREWAKEA